MNHCAKVYKKPPIITDQKMIKKHLPITLLLSGGLLLTAISLNISRPTSNIDLTAAVTTAPHNPNLSAENFKQPNIEDPFVKLNLVARSAIVLDIKTGEIIYAKNIHEKLPLASITKVMTALVAENLMPLSENTVITITPEDLRAEGDSGLDAGQIWKLKDLMDFSLIVSSNDGVRAIAGVAAATSQKDFIEAMNQQASDLELDQTKFKNESGLDLPDNGGAGAQGSAENVARLFAYIYENKPELLEATKQASTSLKPENNDPHFITNTNEVINQIPGIIASKTGYTDLSGGNLAVIFDRGLNQPAVAVVLGSTQQGRFTDMIALTKTSIEDLQIILNSNPRP